MAIKYQAYTRFGKKIKGVLDTDSEERASYLLEQDDLLPYTLERTVTRRSLVQLAPSLFRPRATDVIDFTRQTAALLKSGISLRRVLTVQRDDARSAGLRETLRAILVDIEAGGRFSDAIARHPTVFPNFYVSLMRVGEATGGIAPTLQQLADDLLRRKAVIDRIKKALVYPVITLVVAIAAAIVLVTFSLPSLTRLLKDSNGVLPYTTRALIAVSDFLQANMAAVALPVVGTFLLGIVLMRTPWGSRQWDRILLRIPVAGSIAVGGNMFFLATTLVTLLRAGVSPIESLRLAQEGMSNAVLRESLAAVTRDASEGVRLAEAFARQPAFPPIISQAISTGEMRGNLSDTLAGIAEYYRDRTDRALSGATELIQPAIILLVAGLVGFVAVAVVTGIYSTIGAIN